MPMPPSSAGTVRLGQSRPTNVFHSASPSSSPATTARTRVGGHSRSAMSRTICCSCSCSSSSSKSTFSSLRVRSGLARQQPVEVGPQLGRRERAVLGGEGEVERGQDGPLEVHVEDALGVLGGPLRQLGDARSEEHLQSQSNLVCRLLL